MLKKMLKYYLVDYWKYPLSRKSHNLELEDTIFIVNKYNVLNKRAPIYDGIINNKLSKYFKYINKKNIKILMKEIEVYYTTSSKYKTLTEYEYRNDLANRYEVVKKEKEL